MDEFTKEFEKKFGSTYNYLQLYGVVFDTTENLVTITFLYEENIEEITEEQRAELTKFFEEKLKLNAKIRLKFKKSYLDIQLIKKETCKIIKENFQSSEGEIFEDSIEIVKNDSTINVNIKCEELLCEFLHNRGAEKFLEDCLAKEFIAHFIARIEIDRFRHIDTSILSERESVAQKKMLVGGEKIKRYFVQDVFMLFGQDITPRPEYIKDLKHEKQSVILAGRIFNFQKKSYTKKREKAKGENAKQNSFFTFSLDDGSGKINCTYFSSITNEKKMEKLCDGTHVISVGDLQMFNNNLTYYIRSIGFCGESIEIPEKLEDEPQEEVQTTGEFTRSYIEKSQGNIFEKPPKYNEYIMENTFVVYDFETTGLDTNLCEIIEVGAVKIVGGEIKEVFQTLVKPNERISDIITSVTNITNEMVVSSPSIKTVLPSFYDFCKGSILCGYNSAMFDDKILGVQSKKIDLYFENQTCDVLLLARSKLSSSNYKLGTVVKNLGIVLIGAHRALNDALATAKILLKLNQI